VLFHHPESSAGLLFQTDQLDVVPLKPSQNEQQISFVDVPKFLSRRVPLHLQVGVGLVLNAI